MSKLISSRRLVGQLGACISLSILGTVAFAAPVRPIVLPTVDFALKDVGLVAESRDDLRKTAVTPLGPVLMVQQGGSIAAIDRSSGRLLWRRDPLRTIDGGLSADKQTHLGETTGCSILTEGAYDAASWFVVLNVSRRTVADDASRANGLRIRDYNREETIEATSGRVLWRTEWRDEDQPAGPQPIGNFAGLLLDDPFVNATQFPNRPEQAPLHLRLAATGEAIEPDSVAGRALLQTAAALNHRKALLSPVGSAIYAFDFLNDRVTAVFRGYDYTAGPAAFFRAERRFVLHLNADDDFAGHSIWPMYVSCVSEDGRRVWGLPRVVERPTGLPRTSKAEPYSIARMEPCRAAGCVLCIGDKWYCLDAGDGHILWTLRAPALGPLVLAAEAGRGFVVETSDAFAGGSGWSWVDGRTGRATALNLKLNAVKLISAGDDLYAIDLAGHLSVYSVSAVINSAPKRSRRM